MYALTKAAARRCGYQAGYRQKIHLGNGNGFNARSSSEEMGFRSTAILDNVRKPSQMAH